MKTELILQMWNYHLNAIRPSFERLSDENRKNRLIAATTSYGFNALHTAESLFMFGRFVLGVETTVPYTTFKATDEGQEVDPEQVRALFDQAVNVVTDAIRQIPDNDWDTIIKTPFGEITRLQGLMYLLHHDSYHVGQMVLAYKKGREMVLES